MKINSARTLLAFAFTGCSSLIATACFSSEKGPADSTTKVVGGLADSTGMFASAVLVTNGVQECSATKVASNKVLLAAHCVFATTVKALGSDGHELMMRFRPGNEVKIFSVRDGTPFMGTIKMIHIPPAYLLFCRPLESDCANKDIHKVPELAVIEFDQPILPEVRTARLLLDREIKPGEQVLITGFGCQKGSRVNDVGSRTTQVNYKPVTVEPSEGFVDYDGVANAEYLAISRKLYYWTPGLLSEASSASLCPGDSGSGVYLDDGTQSTVVGVNSFVLIPDAAKSQSGISYVNFHLRLFSEADPSVAMWLRDVTQETVTPMPNPDSGSPQTQPPQGLNPENQVLRPATRPQIVPTHSAPVAVPTFDNSPL